MKKVLLPLIFLLSACGETTPQKENAVANQKDAVQTHCPAVQRCKDGSLPEMDNNCHISEPCAD